VYYINLYEFQSKEILARNGLKTPEGRVIYSLIEAIQVAEELGLPVAVKAQILIGGRGLMGGVKFAHNPSELRNHVTTMFNASFMGERVDCILIEEKIPVIKEYFAGITYDYPDRCMKILASTSGGVEIESIAFEHPDEVIIERIDPFLGLTDFQARRVSKNIGLYGKEMISFASALKKLYKIMVEYDATLIEANPYVLTDDGGFVAVDAKIIIDDNAVYRHPKIFSLEHCQDRLKEEAVSREDMAKTAQIPTYIELDGNMGIVSDGAGTGMLTLDLVCDFGGKIEVYCELGGRANPESIEKAIDIIATNTKVEVLLINLIGGLNRMDEMAAGINAYLSKRPIDTLKPILIVRMSGTLEQEGRAMLKKRGISSYDNIYDAVQTAVKLAGS
jgi:succinyl-CoA synthetase beta subunit